MIQAFFVFILLWAFTLNNDSQQLVHAQSVPDTADVHIQFQETDQENQVQLILINHVRAQIVAYQVSVSYPSDQTAISQITTEGNSLDTEAKAFFDNDIGIAEISRVHIDTEARTTPAPDTIPLGVLTFTDPIEISQLTIDDAKTAGVYHGESIALPLHATVETSTQQSPTDTPTPTPASQEKSFFGNVFDLLRDFFTRIFYGK